MLIFFGTKSKGLSATPAMTSCDNCNQSEQLVYVFQRYFHIFWIPFFPLGKQTILECQHCRKTVLEKEMSEQQKSISLPKRSDATTPAYMFAGLVLVACLIGWGKYTAQQDKANTQMLISSPAANDIAVIKLKSGKYQIIKLTSVENNTVKMQPGTYVYDSLYYAKKAIRKDDIVEKDYFANALVEVTDANYKKIKIEYVEREDLGEEL